MTSIMAATEAGEAAVLATEEAEVGAEVRQ
jgi:hypothetical protein